MKRDLLDALLAVRGDKKPAVLVTRLGDGVQALITASDPVGDAALADSVATAARGALRADRGTTIDTAGGRVFLQVFNPPLRMIIVGAVHIAQPLAPMASLAGYQVTVVDPRRSFASETRFPNIAVSTEWPDEALERLAPDSRTAVVTLTHDPKLDDAALAVALKAEPFYIGSLGSKKTHAARLDRLAREGFSAARTARIHGPIGLALGATSPAEIAIAIMAEVTRVLRRERAT